MNLTAQDIQRMVENIQRSRKYRGLGLNPETTRDLILQEAQNHTSQKSLRKTVRRKLHNIVAQYLGEPDYESLTAELSTTEGTALDSQEIRNFCLKVLAQHASTAERIPLLEEYYRRIFSITGKPEVLLDLACGLHPLAFPWMGLPISTQFYVYDIIQPRINFINAFFKKIGLAPLAINQDILVQPPQTRADLCLFLKEAHRFEKRAAGCNQSFWDRLNTKWLAVSLPTQNLAGTHSLIDQHRELVQANLPKAHQGLHELIFPNEIVFLIKSHEGVLRA
jgi:16S rRNA (guanine(1405)-N(7))-methyltransferase